MRTKTYGQITEQVERIEANMLPNAYGHCAYPGAIRMMDIVIRCGYLYRENIIKHFEGYKNESEFTKIYHSPVTREIYAGY